MRAATHRTLQQLLFRHLLKELHRLVKVMKRLRLYNVMNLCDHYRSRSG